MSSVLRSCPHCGHEFLQDNPGPGIPLRRLCQVCRTPPPVTAVPPPSLLGKPLSSRERQVVAHVARAQSNKVIAYELHLTEGTIKRYLVCIFEKLGVGSRTELAIWYLRQQALDKAA